jgi:FtsZ-binding cell division protein ZapB
MKPGFLQDAIKAKALKLQKEGVEPVVKQHKMTKEEFLSVKELETPNKHRNNHCENHDAPIMMMTPTCLDPKTLQLLELVQRDIKHIKEENIKLKNEINQSTETHESLKKTIQEIKNDYVQLRKDFQSFKDDVLGSIYDIKRSSIAKTTSMSSIVTTNNVVQRFANRPVQINHGFVRRRGGENNDDANGTRDHAMELCEATLSKHPKNLYKLWEEYEFGMEGRKAARKFNLRERGKNKYKYHRRKVVWDRIEEKIRQGHTYHTAIDSLYEQYGRDLSVTAIINKMRKERMEQNVGGRQQTLGFFPPSTSI